MADLLEPLWELMAEGRTRLPRSWAPMTPSCRCSLNVKRPCADVGLRGGQANPYNVFDFTLSRSRDGPGFSSRSTVRAVADAYGGYDGVVAGNDITARCWAHRGAKFVDAEKVAPRSPARRWK